MYLAVIATFICYYLVFKTRFGLRLRAAGYNSNSLDSSGCAAPSMRIQALLLCAVFCGAGGSLSFAGLCNSLCREHDGWPRMDFLGSDAILVDGHPYGIALISLLFGFFDGLGLFLQSYGVSPQFTPMVPYIATSSPSTYIRCACERERKHYESKNQTSRIRCPVLFGRSNESSGFRPFPWIAGRTKELVY